jgi:hypothetical protein
MATLVYELVFLQHYVLKYMDDHNVAFRHHTIFKVQPDQMFCQNKLAFYSGSIDFEILGTKPPLACQIKGVLSINHQLHQEAPSVFQSVFSPT